MLRLRSRSARRRSRTAKSKGEVERRRRTAKSKGAIRSRTALRFGVDLFLGAISLAGAWLVGGVCSLPLSSSSISLSLSLSSLSLSIFRKIVFEGEIKMEINLHPTYGQLKTISGKCNFHGQPNTRKYGKSISGSDFHPKQTQPNFSNICRNAGMASN